MCRVQFFKYSPSSYLQRDSLQERVKRRPASNNVWQATTENNSNLRLAAVVKFATPEDAFSGWRLRHDQMHTFSDGSARLLKCKVLE